MAMAEIYRECRIPQMECGKKVSSFSDRYLRVAHRRYYFIKAAVSARPSDLWQDCDDAPWVIGWSRVMLILQNYNTVNFLARIIKECEVRKSANISVCFSIDYNYVTYLFSKSRWRIGNRLCNYGCAWLILSCGFCIAILSVCTSLGSLHQ